VIGVGFVKFIEGVNRYQKTIFPDVLDDYIISENPVRVIDAFVDSLDLNDLGFLSEKKQGVLRTIRMIC